MKHNRAFKIAFVACGLLILVFGTTALFLGNAIALAQNEGPNSVTAESQEFLAFGITGIVNGQTARLHVIPVGVLHDQTVELMIFNNDGNLLTHSIERLSPGHAASLSLPFSPSTIDVRRMEFYAVVRFPNGKPRRGYLISTLDVVDDATGGTIYAIANPEG